MNTKELNMLIKCAYKLLGALIIWAGICWCWRDCVLGRRRRLGRDAVQAETRPATETPSASLSRGQHLKSYGFVIGLHR